MAGGMDGAGHTLPTSPHTEPAVAGEKAAGGR